MVGPARFELTTSCTPCKRSTRLNYGPTFSQNDRVVRLGTRMMAGCLCFATDLFPEADLFSASGSLAAPTHRPENEETQPGEDHEEGEKLSTGEAKDAFRS